MHTHSYISMCDFWYCLFWAMNGCLFWWMVLSIEAFFILKHRQVRLEHVWCNRGSCYIPVRVWDFLWVPISFMGWEIYTGQRHCVDCVDRFFFFARSQLFVKVFARNTPVGLKLKRHPIPARNLKTTQLDSICPAAADSLFQEMRRKWVDAQMAEWGVSRARSCGWWDGYTFSKAIAEMLVHAACSFLSVFLLMFQQKKCVSGYILPGMYESLQNILGFVSWVCSVDEDFSFGFLYTYTSGTRRDPTPPEFLLTPKARDPKTDSLCHHPPLRCGFCRFRTIARLGGCVFVGGTLNRSWAPNWGKNISGDEIMASPCSLDKYCRINSKDNH